MDQHEIKDLFYKKKKPAPQFNTEKVQIHNLIELKKLIKRLEPTKDEDAAPIVIDTKKTRMADESYSGMVTIPQSGGQSTLRRTLLDGFELVKGNIKYYEASIASQNMEDEYGGFQPAVAPNPDNHYTWLDSFIDRNMGGKREGLFIVWELPEGKFKLDPWTCQLEKVDA